MICPFKSSNSPKPQNHRVRKQSHDELAWSLASLTGKSSLYSIRSDIAEDGDAEVKGDEDEMPWSLYRIRSDVAKDGDAQVKGDEDEMPCESCTAPSSKGSRDP